MNQKIKAYGLRNGFDTIKLETCQPLDIVTFSQRLARKLEVHPIFQSSIDLKEIYTYYPNYYCNGGGHSLDVYSLPNENIHQLIKITRTILNNGGLWKRMPNLALKYEKRKLFEINAPENPEVSSEFILTAGELLRNEKNNLFHLLFAQRIDI